MSKQTAGNNEVLAAIKIYWGNKDFFKTASALMNSEGEQAVIDYVQSNCTMPITRETIIDDAEKLKAILV